MENKNTWLCLVTLMAIVQLGACSQMGTKVEDSQVLAQKEKRERKVLSDELREELNLTKKEIIKEIRTIINQELVSAIETPQQFSKNILKKQKKVKRSLKSKTVIGRIENIVLDSTGFGVKARIDTGAKTCSMHAENIIEKKVEGKTYIQFTSENTERKKQSFYKEIIKKQRVRSSTGDVTDRYVIKMAVEMGGRIHEVNVNLNDREDLRYNFLVGRNLLMGDYVVDVSQTRLLGK